MANNPYINKVELANGITLIDLTSDTVTERMLVAGVTAHDKSGAAITGSMFSVGDVWSTTLHVHPRSVLGVGTWKLIRKSVFTWGEAGKQTWNELKGDTWGWDTNKKCVYVWLRTA